MNRRRTVALLTKPRHAAALALVGWYLMTPPISGSPSCSRIDDSVPLSAWQQMDSFDSASECEAQLHFDVSHATKILYPADCNLVHTAAMQTYHEICIATDDPRLKEK